MPSINRATIKVASIIPPKEGGKMGKVKTDTGNYYRVWNDKLHNFEIGKSYSVDYEVGEWQGNVQRTIKAIMTIAVDLAPAQTPEAAALTPTQSKAPTNGSAYRETSRTDAERMFVCGVLNAAIRAGTVDPRDSISVLEIVNQLRSVWSQSFGQA